VNVDGTIDCSAGRSASTKRWLASADGEWINITRLVALFCRPAMRRSARTAGC
jgi:hypothetical protein